MTDIQTILCKELDAILDENMDRMEKAIEHIKLKHDPEHYTRYVDGEQNKYGRYLKGHFEPYKNDMRNHRLWEFKIGLYGRIND